jgi:hypothetical protein
VIGSGCKCNPDIRVFLEWDKVQDFRVLFPDFVATGA